MELELREIRERPLIFFIFIAILIHIVAGAGVYYYLQTPIGEKITGLPEFTDKGLSNLNEPGDQTPAVIAGDNQKENMVSEDETAVEDIDKVTQQAESTEEESIEIPPFEQSELNANRLNDSTFLHENSGLLFADEIPIPGSEDRYVKKKKIIKPVINREFKISNLPSEFRDREWNLALRVSVDESGHPAGKIRVIKSSGNAVLDQIIITRVEGSTFDPAHYEGTDHYIDYTYDLEINIK